MKTIRKMHLNLTLLGHFQTKEKFIIVIMDGYSLLEGSYQEGTKRDGSFKKGIFREGNIWVGIVRGRKSGWRFFCGGNCPGGELYGVEFFLWGSCPV